MAEPSCLLCAQNCRRIHGEACSAGASFPGFALVVTRSCLDEDYLVRSHAHILWIGLPQTHVANKSGFPKSLSTTGRPARSLTLHL